MLQDLIIQTVKSGRAYRVDWPTIALHCPEQDKIAGVERWAKENGMRVLWEPNNTGAVFAKAE